MSMLATNIGSVPCGAFEWYLIMLEGRLNDPIRDQIDRYFSSLGKAVGPNVLVVRGYDPDEFRKSFFEAQAFYGDGLPVEGPALIVTDAVPGQAARRDGLKTARVIAFPLQELHRQGQGDISGFLNNLLNALKAPDAFEALHRLDRSKLETTWGWLSNTLSSSPVSLGLAPI